MTVAIARRLALVALAAGVCLPAQAAAWEHNGLEWDRDRFPLPIHLQPAPPDDTDLETIAEIVQSAFTSWNEVPCSYAELEYVGIEDLPIAVDDDQVLGWANDPETWLYGTATAGATIIDVTGDNGPRVDIWFNDISFRWIVGANTFVTPGLEWDEEDPLEVDPESVVLHEVGHLLGLSHPNPNVEGSQPDGLATMVFALLPNAQQATLAADDKLGLCARYPITGESECIADSDCPDSSYFCETFDTEFVDEVALCEESRGQIGDFCGIDAYVCAGICLFTTTDYSEGFCTAFCDEHEDCPEEPELWACDELPTTAGEPVFACVPGDRDEPVGDSGIGVVDSGLPTLADAGGSDDAGGDDAGADSEDDTGDESDGDTAADASDDDDEGTSSRGGGGGGCAAAPSGRAAPSALALFGLAWLVRRRR